jgi:hypothetical protein
MSKNSQTYTLEDLETLSLGSPTEEVDLSTEKRGLNPVHTAVLLSAIQSGSAVQMLKSLTEENSADGPTQADRIEEALGTIVDLLGSLDSRLGKIESRLAPR